MDKIIQTIANEFNIKYSQVENTVKLIDEGNTIPFIARYRKEVTGNLSDETLRDLDERLTYLRNLEKRKEEVIKSIDEQGKLTEELLVAIGTAKILSEVEDLYRPYKQKKRTRATIAKEKGLEPLAKEIIKQDKNIDIYAVAKEYIDEEKEIKSEEDAINGALDIIAEDISDNAKYRKEIKRICYREGQVVTRASKPEEKSNYEMYYEYKEPIKSIPSHRILAINRGEKEQVLQVKLNFNDERVINYLEKNILKNNEVTDEYLKKSVRDSFKRLIYPSIEREIRSELTSRGEDSAIGIFKANLKSLLMQAPIKGKVVIGFDPGFRTGCKIAVLDDTGKFIENATVYPTMPKNDIDGSIRILKELIYKYDVDVISLGNGTASRESEDVIERLIKEVKEEKGKDLYYVIVSEAGASVYSASELANKEYPNLDVTVRGAISIGRRLQDPLVELVKIDPKAIGVGQYQHDVSSKKLDESLKGVVEDCVNNVGVDLNIVTPSLLSYIAGINGTIAKNIVNFREENGKFANRKELLKVKRLGKKAYEQCAGFLRVSESDEVLDNTSVHPESYEVAKKLIEILGYDKRDLKLGKLKDIDEKIKIIGINKLADELSVGILTLKDIIKELKKPGRDPREELPKPILKSGVINIKDLKKDMLLMGTVRNVSDFGAFIDIGVHQDGLVHKSQMANKFVKHPLDIVKVGDIVRVKILEIDEKRKRISLSMKDV